MLGLGFTFQRKRGVNIMDVLSSPRVRRSVWKSLSDDVRELEARDQDPGAVVQNRRCVVCVHARACVLLFT